MVVVLLLHQRFLVVRYRLQVVQVLVQAGLFLHDRRLVACLRHCLHLDFRWRLGCVHVDPEVVFIGQSKDLHVVSNFAGTAKRFFGRAPTSVTLRTHTVAVAPFWKRIVLRFNRRVTVEMGQRVVH